jgi:hypothetical protein
VRVKDGSLAADGDYYNTFEDYESHVMLIMGATDPEIARSIIIAWPSARAWFQKKARLP